MALPIALAVLACAAALDPSGTARAQEGYAFQQLQALAQDSARRPRAEAPPVGGGRALPAAPGSEAVGSYVSGRLNRAARLPPAGDGFVKIERRRGRAWGTDELAAALQAIGARYRKAFPDGARVQIGDLSGKNGGTITLHKSHTNGLDADIALAAAGEREQDPEREGFDRDFVENGRLSGDFDAAANWELARAAAAQPLVERLFVAPEVKALFCRLHGAEPESRDALRILRPAAHHSDHYHLRLRCPAGDRRCVPQAPVAEGTGCDGIGALGEELDSPD
ncbi:MAG: hypothetical protein A2X36_00085 [Elusimicrobia bacterium GWA2_69_24]|nr:MAG: hypothetical protein A2X36_00085 [Elusimicrobia bacterium GWA2_69_24]HBL19077.1 hypothetical protein [Elusimicrobiota bacterium]